MTNLSWPVVIIDPAGDMHKGTLSNTSKQNIRDLFIKLLDVGHTSDNDDELLDKLRQKIEEL